MLLNKLNSYSENLPVEYTAGPGEYHQTFKEEMIPILHTVLENKGRRGHFLTHLMKHCPDAERRQRHFKKTAEQCPL